MKWRAKSFGESVLPMETMCAVVGQGVFHYPPGRRHTILSSIYAITVSLLYYIAVGLMLKLCYESPWYKDSSGTFLAVFYSSLVTSAISQILSWYHGRRFFDIAKKISKIDETLQGLGATFDYTATMKTGIAVVISWILTCSTLNAIDILWLFGLMPFKHIIFIVTVIHHPLNMNSIVVLSFATALRRVRKRFRKANQLLERITIPVRRPVNNQAWRYMGKNVGISTLTMATRNISKDEAYRRHVMEIIKHVHLELSTISEELNRAYGIQVILEITTYFALITGLLYEIYRGIADTSTPRRYWRLTVHFTWFSTYLAKLVLINQACEAVSTEARRTGNILHHMDGTIRDYEFHDEIEQFALQIIQNPVVFSPAGLVTLGWKFVHEFLAMVTTYLIILIQMRG